MRYFFVGIGGVSMSALAKLLLNDGHKIYGSDMIDSLNIKELSSLGITTYIGHSNENIKDKNIDYLIINGAISDDNPELFYAKENNIKIISREQLLAEVSRKYENVIAVAGCHGKSSTTAIVGEIFKLSGKEPTVHNGVKDNLYIGKKKYFITEACEFKRSFLTLEPKIAIITNVDKDHLDCYKDLNDIKNTFQSFSANVDILIKNVDDRNSIDLKGKKQTITFGINYGDIHTKNLKEIRKGCYSFDLVLDKNKFGVFNNIPTFKMQVAGKHNIYNALAGIACGLMSGINVSLIKEAIFNYRGISRRFEILSKLNNTEIILDYAHHPKEILTTIDTAKSLYKNYLIVFQPHTYTRTIALWNEFILTLAKIPNLILYKTFAAREKEIRGGRAFDLQKILKCKYFAKTKSLKNYIKKYHGKYDAIILCGAGDVVSGEFLIKDD